VGDDFPNDSFKNSMYLDFHFFLRIVLFEMDFLVRPYLPVKIKIKTKNIQIDEWKSDLIFQNTRASLQLYILTSFLERCIK